MTALFVTLGTKGDVYPFLGLAREIRAAGHRAVILTSEAHRRDVEAAGLEFESIQSAADHERLTLDPNTWKPFWGIKNYLERAVAPSTKPAFMAINKHARGGKSFVVANSLMFGAHIAGEILGVPVASVFLQPYGHLSAADPAKDSPLANFTMSCAGHAGRRWLGSAATALFNSYLSEVQRFRLHMGLPRHPDLMGHARYEAPLLLNLWPDWYCPVKPDWPRGLLQTGFIDYTPGRAEEADPQLKEFLAEKPVIFTMGSGYAGDLNRQINLFSETCDLLGAPGLLISAGLRTGLFKGEGRRLRMTGPLPFAPVFPHARAVVHHGGIGTAAKAYAAGVPQVITPLAFDQFDNGEHVRRSGAGFCLPFRNITAAALAECLAATRRLKPVKREVMGGAACAAAVIEETFVIKPEIRAKWRMACP